MHGWTDGRPGERAGGRADGRAGGRADGRVSGRADGRTGEQADGWAEGGGRGGRGEGESVSLCQVTDDVVHCSCLCYLNAEADHYRKPNCKIWKYNLMSQIKICIFDGTTMFDQGWGSDRDCHRSRWVWQNVATDSAWRGGRRRGAG